MAVLASGYLCHARVTRTVIRSFRGGEGGEFKSETLTKVSIFVA